MLPVHVWLRLRYLGAKGVREVSRLGSNVLKKAGQKKDGTTSPSASAPPLKLQRHHIRGNFPSGNACGGCSGCAGCSGCGACGSGCGASAGAGATGAGNAGGAAANTGNQENSGGERGPAAARECELPSRFCSCTAGLADALLCALRNCHGGASCNLRKTCPELHPLLVTI